MRGFCLLGCKVGAKSSTLVSHIPDAIEHGAEIRTGCMAFEIAARRRRPGRPASATIRTLDDGRPVEEEQRARAVIVAGYAIESPRLLLNSTLGPLPRRAGQLQRAGRQVPDGPGRAGRLGPLRRD